MTVLSGGRLVICAAISNPRTQDWQQHFALDGALIVPRTPIGRVTVAILQLNHPDRLLERESLIRIRRYP